MPNILKDKLHYFKFFMNEVSEKEEDRNGKEVGGEKEDKNGKEMSGGERR